MKFKAIILGIFIVASTLTVHSQSKLSLGFEAGLNIANTNQTPSTSFGSKTGFIIGAVLDAPITPTFNRTGPQVHYQR